MRRIVNGIRLLLAAVFMVGLFAVATPQAGAANCENRVRNAERNLDKQQRKHGHNSRQVQNARRQLEEARERCNHRGRRGDRDHDRH